MKSKEQKKMIHDLLDKVLEVQEKTNNYVNLEVSNYGPDVIVQVMEGGFSKTKEYALSGLYNSEAIGGTRYTRMVEYLDTLLREETKNE